MTHSIAYILPGLYGICFTAVFFFTWQRMPASWLFDTADTAPHPLARQSTPFSWIFPVFLVFFALSLTFSKKVAQIDVFWLLSLFWFLAQTALADLCYRLIPDQWSLGIAALGALRLADSVWNANFGADAAAGSVSAAFASTFWPLLPSLCFCASVWLLLYAFPELLNRSPLLGLGDIKLLLALSLALPKNLFFCSLIYAALLGGVAGIVLLLNHREKRGVPFGSVLALGVACAVLL